MKYLIKLKASKCASEFLQKVSRQNASADWTDFYDI